VTRLHGRFAKRLYVPTPNAELKTQNSELRLEASNPPTR